MTVLWLNWGKPLFVGNVRGEMWGSCATGQHLTLKWFQLHSNVLVLYFYVFSVVVI